MPPAWLTRIDDLRRRWKQRWDRAIDEELVILFHYSYLIIFIAAGLYLIVVAQGLPEPVRPVMGTGFYVAWCWLNIICPLATMVGKHFTKSSAQKAEGEPNLSVGAAWLQLAGDGGIWGVVIIYLICWIQTSWWGMAAWAVFFVFMGVPGGFMFTLRSVRRLRQIGRVSS